MPSFAPLARKLRRGTAAVEFAVIAPVFVTLTMGMMEVTRAIQVKSYLTDAARSSCRLATQPGSSNSTVTANINTILTSNGLNPSDATITIQVNGNTADVNTAQKYQPVSVKIAIPISKVSWVPLSIFSSSSLTSETLVMMHN